MNPFESGERKLIPATLVYAFSGDQVLMLHRNARADDFHSGKWNGLGGKLEGDESPSAGAAREFAEEAGLALPAERFQLLGTILFPRFKPRKSEDWLCFVFCVRLDAKEAGAIARVGAEGELHWILDSDILSLPLWPGDVHFIPHVLKQEPFHGTIWYEDGLVARSEIN